MLFIDNIILIIKSENNKIFVGFNDLKIINSNIIIKRNANSFLFSLTKNTKHQCKKTGYKIRGSKYNYF